MIPFLELLGAMCLVIELPFMVGGTGFLVWEMINAIKGEND